MPNSIRSIIRLVPVFTVVPALLIGCAEPRAAANAAQAAVAETSAHAHSEVRLANAEFPVIQVYKSPTCGCCTAWVDHMEEAGFKTEVHDMANVNSVKALNGIPQHLHSCHTSVVGNYVIEGHVPADVVRRLLTEKPEVTGIAVPGMPMGSPGMEGPFTERYDIIAFRHGGGQFVFESR